MDGSIKLDELNAAQRQAVLAPPGPLLVLAGAGTGKTRVVTYRIAELIRQGVAADRILAVTFTNKAASEMQQRIRERLGRRMKQQPLVSTFHSLCVRILRRHIVKLGYSERFAIYARGDQESLVRTVLREIRVPGKALQPSELLSIIGRWKTHSLQPQQAAAAAQSDKEHVAAVAYRRYQQALKNAGAVDFDDLLMLVEELFSKSSTVRKAEAANFDHLLIDEYQDTNASQYRIAQGLAADHRNLCVVGDDDQSIYGWRGARVEHILRFKHDWPDATVVRLEENYRSTAKILELANRLITFNKLRHEKVLRATRPGGEPPRIEQFRDETAEAKSTVADIQRRLSRGDVSASDFAILFRTNEQPRSFETELRRAKLPYVLIGGLSFFDRKEVRDVLAYLRVLDAPRDEVSLLRIINTPARGLSQKAVESLREAATSQGSTVWDVLTDKKSGVSLSTAARSGADQLIQLVNRHRKQSGSRPIAEIARELVREIDYEAHLTSRYEDPNERDARWNAVEDVVNAIASYEKQNGRTSLTTLLDDLALTGRDFENDKENQLNRNAIVLMTLHSAKGLEFPFVYMVGLEEGLLPHRRSVEVDGDAIDEERRLCYVGVTRAQERLTLSLAQSRMKWGKPRESIPSRFLFEMIGKAEKT